MPLQQSPTAIAEAHDFCKPTERQNLLPIDILFNVKIKSYDVSYFYQFLYINLVWHNYIYKKYISIYIFINNYVIYRFYTLVGNDASLVEKWNAHFQDRPSEPIKIRSGGSAPLLISSHWSIYFGAAVDRLITLGLVSVATVA